MRSLRSLRLLCLSAATSLLFAAPGRANDDFDFSPLGLEDLTLAQAEPQPGTGNAPVTVTADETLAEEEGALAKAAQNPIASMSSLPIQWNATPSTQWGPRLAIPGTVPTQYVKAEPNQTLNVVNVQPVIPFKVNKDITLVTRTIVPFIS